MSKIIMLSVGCLEILAGLIFLLFVRFTFMGILFIMAGALFIASWSLTKKVNDSVDTNV